MVRKSYLDEYRRVKALHDANLQARWDQGVINKSAKQARKAARRVIMLARQERYYNQFADRRRIRRNRSRFTRQNKEMKYRRLQIHQINYILREREHNWIQPTLDARTNELVQSKNLSTRLFEKQEFITGFWPKRKEEDDMERRQEKRRREATKL